MIHMLPDILVHFLIGLLGAGTGFLVRGACRHNGWLPHPRAQIALTMTLVAIEAAATVPLIG